MEADKVEVKVKVIEGVSFDNNQDMEGSFTDSARDLLRTYGEVPPVIAGVNGSEMLMVEGPPIGDPRVKDGLKAYLSNLFKEKGVSRYVCVFEAWAADADKAPDGNVSEAEDKFEAIVVCSVDHSDKNVTIYPIRRDGDRAWMCDPAEFDTPADGGFLNLLENQSAN